MTAHFIRHGEHPSMHPGVLRKIVSLIIFMAPVPTTGREVLGPTLKSVGIFSSRRVFSGCQI